MWRRALLAVSLGTACYASSPASPLQCLHVSGTLLASEQAPLPPPPLNPTGVPVVSVYADAEGVSHFRDFTIPLEDQGDIGSLSEMFNATGVSFRYTPGTYNFDFHQAPRRQFVINLIGEVEIEVGDGEVRRLPQGQIILVEDTIGKGHVSRAINNQPRYSLFIAIPDSVTFS